jgi:Cu2+-exporting ATPase
MSRHPLSVALAAAADGLNIPDVSDVHEIAGSGVEGTTGGSHVRLGRRGWATAGVDVGVDGFGGPELWYRDEVGRAHRFRFRDAVKEDAQTTISQLKELGLDVCILSGDRSPAVAEIAAEVGIETWDAECRPDMKVHVIDGLRSAGRRVLMVGDGLNDAPALAAGFVSASPASAADITRTASDIVFQGKCLAPIVSTIKIARFSQTCMRQNIALAIGYNALAVPIAVAGLVTPLIAAIAMSSSSLLVTLNALRLNRVKPQ